MTLGNTRRSRSRAKRGRRSHLSESLVFVGYSTTSPPTQCAPRWTCTQPVRQSTSDQSRPAASHRLSPRAAAHSTTASHSWPTTARRAARSSAAVRASRRTTGAAGSSTPCVTSQIRSCRFLIVQR